MPYPDERLRRPSTAMAEPMHDVHWLQAVALAGLFCYHCATLFDVLGASAGAATPPVLRDFIAVVGLWAMPLLFTACGVAAASALRRQSALRYVLTSARRLLLPMAFGMVVLAPPQVVLEQWLSVGRSSVLEGNSLAYLALPVAVDVDSVFSGRHLWFLLVLFGGSALLLPVTYFLRSTIGRKLWALGLPLFTKPAMLVAPAVVTMLIAVAGAPDGTSVPSLRPWSLLGYLLMFLYGHAVLADARARASVDAIGPYVLLLAILGTPTALRVCAPGAAVGAGCAPAALVGLVQWCWVLGLLYVGQACMNRDNAVLEWFKRAATPFYVLHLPVIVAVGYGLVHWQLPTSIKYVIVATVSLVAVLILCELVVRRVGALRALLGYVRAGHSDAGAPTMAASAR